MFENVKCTQKCDVCGSEYTYEVPYMEPDPAIFKGSYCNGRFHLHGACLGKSNDILNICPRCDTEIGNLLERLAGHNTLHKCPACGHSEKMFFAVIDDEKYIMQAVCGHCRATFLMRRDKIWQCECISKDEEQLEIDFSMVKEIYPASEIRDKRYSADGWIEYCIDIKS